MNAKKISEIQNIPIVRNENVSLTNAPVRKPGILSRAMRALFEREDSLEDFERLEGLRPKHSKDPWSVYRAYWGRF